MLNILIKSIENYFKKIKPKYVLHAAALSRPMNIHDKKFQSIDLNIIGTANIVKVCEKYKIKLIYFSTNYVYPGKKELQRTRSCLTNKQLRGLNLAESVHKII